jgi:AAA ATPase domain
VPDPELPRPALLDRVLARVTQGAPVLLTGPPGAGKTTILLAVARSLAARGWAPVYLDMMGAASSPERFVVAFLDALPADSFGALLGRATQLRRLAEPGGDGASAVRALFSLWAALVETGGRPAALLLDEPTEIRSLAYFAGLRESAAEMGQALRRRTRGTLMATSYATQARALWGDVETIEVPPLSAAEMESVLSTLGLGARAPAILRASFGWPRYARPLVERLRQGDDLETAWAEEMAPGGRLETACRHTYETLLLRSRGYGMSKAVLAAVADDEGANLTTLVARLGRSPGAIRDYLGWLLDVDALRVSRKRYYYVDGMVRDWVRLHARGRSATAKELREAARAAVGSAAGATPEPAPAAGRDSLMEID